MRVVDGVRLVHVSDPSCSLVQYDVLIEAGSFRDPVGKEGLANLTVHAVLRGAGRRSYRRITDAINDMGADLEIQSQRESMGVAGDVLPRYLGPLADLVGDMVGRPSFPVRGVRQERALVLEDLRNLINDDSELVHRFFSSFLYRGHPLGRATDGTRGSVSRLNSADCREFHDRHVHRENMVVLLAGDVDDNTADAFVRRLVQDIPHGSRDVFDVSPVPFNDGVRVLIVDKPDRNQTQVAMGHPSLAWGDPDLFSVLVGNTALGGTFTSLLMREIREVRGWSYGVSSGITAGRTSGTFVVRFFPSTADTIPAIELARELLQFAADGNQSSQDLEFARDYLVHQFPFRVETARKRAEEKVADLLLDRPAGFLENFVDNVKSRDDSAVRSAMSRWIRPESLAITIVGTAADLLPQLQSRDWVSSVEVVPYDSDY